MNPISHRGRRLAVSALYDGAFKMLVDTTLAGSAADAFVFPGFPTTYAYDCVIDWGDGSLERFAGTGNLTHTYAAAGQYVVSIHERIPGGFPGLYFNNGGDKLKVLKLLQFGSGRWATLDGAFYGCSNLVIDATDGHRALTKYVANMSRAFRGCAAMTKMPVIDTSGVTTMLGAFYGCTLLREFPKLNTSAVTIMTDLCLSCTSLKDFPLIDTSKVTSFATAWNGCSGLLSFPFIDTALGQSFAGAWTNCTGMNGYDFPTLDMHNITAGNTMLQGVNHSKASYNSMLDQFANGRGSIPAAAATGISFRTGAHYDASTGGYDGTTARGYLTGTKTWTIVDGGTP